MNDLYIIAAYYIREKLLAMNSVGASKIANAVASFRDMANDEDEEITRELIDGEISSKHQFKRDWKNYQIVVKKLSDLEKKPLYK